jgi:hypothetical protein
MPILHPSYLLRNPSRQQGSPKWLTWHDLQDVRRRLDQLSGDHRHLQELKASDPTSSDDIATY